ncbi:M13 family metallopeptidase [Steroidobacter sp.]|uniref:M13 family metallopeptidase n=1 Tax=Steroidobacter sp. TaxID=1978227 RepID=UPI0025D5C42A|nr:M13 family metallopeptidase [Steroidobacter sp.]
MIHGSVALLLSSSLFASAAWSDTAALRGVYVGDIDASVEPCDDMFQHSNGKWHRENPVPASQPRWSRRWEAGEIAKDQLRTILEAAARSNAPAGSSERQIGDFYAACMDESALNRLGVRPVQPLLDRVDAIRQPADLQQAIATLHAVAIDVPFRLHAESDSHDPTRVIANIAGAGRGRGLPDRDYYLSSEPRFEAARDRYKLYIAKLLQLAGTSAEKAKAAAETVLRMETQFARASLDNVSQRNPKAMDNQRSFAELRKLTPTFDWQAYYGASGLQPGDVNVVELRLMEEFDRQLRSTSLADWKTYLRWHVLDSAAPSLSAPFVQEEFDFRSAYLRGATQIRPRAVRCAEATDIALGEALGQKYVEQYFSPEAKARAQTMVDNLRLALRETIEELTWMTPPTKARALEKLAAFQAKVGYPDRWKDYSSVSIRRDAYWESVLAGRRFAVSDGRATINRPVDRSRWDMTPPTSNAGYRALRNEIIIPAGILQPPSFDMQAVDAVNYGAIGSVIGHELIHGFDDKGSQYDGQGRLNNWWAADDLANFKSRGECIVQQYENYFVEPGIHHNGRLTLGEAIADQAGVRLAYRALKISQRGKPAAPMLDGLTPEQQFFISWGQFRGDVERPEFARSMMQSDNHPTGKYRVVGPLSNLTEFQQTFACRAGQPMVRPAPQRCEVW